MNNKIHLGQVPRRTNGKIDYSQIKSMAVRIMVAEEEIRQLVKRYRRATDPRDFFTMPKDQIEGLKNNIAVAMQKLDHWKTTYGGMR